MDALTITHVRTSLQVRPRPTLQAETELRVLRSSLLAPLYLAQSLQLPGVEHALCRLISECDRLLEEVDR